MPNRSILAQRTDLELDKEEAAREVLNQAQTAFGVPLNVRVTRAGLKSVLVNRAVEEHACHVIYMVGITVISKIIEA